MALTNHFTEKNGSDTFENVQLVAGDPLDLNTAAEREAYYDELHLNPERMRDGNNVDVMSWQVGDSGNEGTLANLNDMASVTSGELGKNRTLERDVDQSLQARTGSRSFNLSDNRQEQHDARWEGELNEADPYGEWNGSDALEFAPDVDALLAERDPNIAVEYMIEELYDKLPPELHDDVYDATMSGDAYAQLSALEEIAHANDLNELSQYAQDVNKGFADAGVARAAIYENPLELVVDVASLEPDEQAPAPVMPTPAANDPVYQQQVIQPPNAA
ncbi:MAG: hypothetical protein ACRBDL_06885 [Alphaproteobacteria bacterium]